MNLPGFTGEVSLYKTDSHYRGVGAGARTDHSISAAYVQPRSCFQRCISQCSPDDPYCDQNCSCICFGHPGKTCWLQ